MEQYSLEHIKVLLTVARFLGLTYFTHKKSSTTIQSTRLIDVIIRAIVAVVCIICACYYSTALNWDEATSTIRTSSIVGGLVCFVLKWILYYMKRKKIENIILKVTA